LLGGKSLSTPEKLHKARVLMPMANLDRGVVSEKTPSIQFDQGSKSKSLRKLDKNPHCKTHGHNDHLSWPLPLANLDRGIV